MGSRGYRRVTNCQVDDAEKCTTKWVGCTPAGKRTKSGEALARAGQEGVVRRASALTARPRERRAAPFDGDSGHDDPEEAAIKRINLSRARARAPPPRPTPGRSCSRGVLIQRTRLEASKAYGAISFFPVPLSFFHLPLDVEHTRDDCVVALRTAVKLLKLSLVTFIEIIEISVMTLTKNPIVLDTF